MTTFMPKEVREGLENARKVALKKKNRLRVEANDARYSILRFWDDGFALDAENAPHLRGLVDIFDGSKHLYQCLIVASEIEDDEMRYDFKWATAAHDSAPLDFVREENAPIALLAR